MIQLLSLSFLPFVLVGHTPLCMRPTSVTLGIYSSEIFVHYLWPGRWEILYILFLVT